VDDKVLKERLGTVRSRGQVKALGLVLDTDPDARAAAERLAGRRSIGAVEELTGKKLVRALLERADGAQVRSNPIHRDECFDCIHCQESVEPGGSQIRDHCPYCLHGRHVDNVPGDRAASCGGLLTPVDFSIEGRSGVVIAYTCTGCKHTFRVRAHADDELPKGLRLKS
jgi:hypothetical protein